MFVFEFCGFLGALIGLFSLGACIIHQIARALFGPGEKYNKMVMAAAAYEVIATKILLRSNCRQGYYSIE